MIRFVTLGQVLVGPGGGSIITNPTIKQSMTYSTEWRVVTSGLSYGMTLEEYIVSQDDDGFSVRSIQGSIIQTSDQGPAFKHASVRYLGGPFLWTKDVAISPASPTVSGFTPAVGGYAFNGDHPAGILLDANTGIVSGTPTTEIYSSSFRVLVTDDVGKTHNSSIRFTVQYAPSISYGGSPFSWTEDETIVAADVTSSAGQVSSYAFEGSHPTGILLNTTTGRLTGTPTTVAAGSFVVRATGPTGLTDDATVDYTVSSVVESSTLMPLFTGSGYWTNDF